MPRLAAHSRPAALLGLLVACRPAPVAVPAVDPAYAAAIEAWRAERIDDLRAPQGWLALAGLYWLSDGDYRIGADTSADIQFPAGAPPDIGTVTLAAGEVRLRVNPGVDARLAGAPITDRILRSDRDPTQPADRVTLGERFTFLVIARGDRLGLRIYDHESDDRRRFTTVPHFPVDPAWRLTARFEPLPTPRTIEHPTVLGTVQPAEVPGVAVFTIDNTEHRLTPIIEHDPAGDKLLFVFNDLTAGHDTYKGGRFLLAELPHDNLVELDFNRAHNPPCAFTAYATCPIPLAENELPLAVRAGEKAP